MRSYKMKALIIILASLFFEVCIETSAVNMPFDTDESRSNDPLSFLSNQTKTIFGQVKNNIKKDANKIEGVVTNATDGLKNLTEIAENKKPTNWGEYGSRSKFRKLTCSLIESPHLSYRPLTSSKDTQNQDWLPFCVGKKAADQAVECYPDLGCFPNVPPWFSLLRPFPKPMKPTDIDTKIYLYTSKSPKDRYDVTLWDNITLEASDFDSNRPYTAFITHGFSSNGNVSWVSDLKDAYLKHREANVFIVDWGKGASVWNYLQVAANTRIAGAELARFVKYLIEKRGLDPSRIHLMGHSLGAHISSYAAKAAQTVGQKKKVAQLTAFDPAQPGFEGNPDQVRLAKSDAEFVDVIHTNARPVIPLLGFGLILPTGHIDYYLNGGLLQPGCKLPPIDEVKISGIADLAKYPVEVISSWVSCSHGKSYLYYTEALLNSYCTFWGRSAGVIGSTFDIATFGRSEKILSKFTTCTLDECSPIGLESSEYPARGVFSVSTHSGSPYCFTDPKVTESMQKQRSLKQEKEKTGVTEKNKSIFSKIAGSIV